MIAFKNDIDNHSWEYVMNSDNAQVAYELFHKGVTQLYERHFPYRKIKLNEYKRRKAWLTEEPETAIKRKNGWHIKQLKSDNVIFKKQYLKYNDKLQKY